MKEENKEFYKSLVDDDLTEDQVDAILDAYGELCEDILLDFQHMTADEKRKKEKWLKSAEGKKSVAKTLRKMQKANYRPNQALSRLMKKVGKFARHESFDMDEVIYHLDPSFISEADIAIIDSIDDPKNMTEEQSAAVSKILNLCSEAMKTVPSDDEVMESLSVDELAEFDKLVDDLQAFSEACDVSDDELDDVVVDENDEKLSEVTSMADLKKARKQKAKWLKTAAGKASARKSALRAKRPHTIDASRRKSAKLAAKTRKRLGENINGQFVENDELGLLKFIFNADEILKEYEEDGFNLDELKEACSKLKEDDDIDDDDIVIVIPVSSDEEDDVASAADECDVEIVHKQESEDGNLWVVEGDYDSLESFLSKVGIQDEVYDLIPNDDEDNELKEFTRFKKHSAGERAKNRKDARAYRRAHRQEINRYNRRRNKKIKSGALKINKNRSKEMKRILNASVEAVEQTLESYLSKSPLLGGLNEGQNNELMAVIQSTVMKLVTEASESIGKNISELYEDYYNNEVIPEMTKTFDLYKDMMRDSLYEDMNEYLSDAAQQIANELTEKKFFVKSPKSDCLESFATKLVKMIEEDLNIYPKQEDAMAIMRNKLDEMNSELLDSRIEQRKLNLKLEESKKTIYLNNALPATLTESEKDDIINYATVNLSDKSFIDFKLDIDKKINRIVESKLLPRNNAKNLNEDLNKKPQSNGEFDFMKLFNR